MTDITHYFDIGVIVKPQGIKGELRVAPVTDEPSRFELLDEAVLVFKNGTVKSFPIERSRSHGNLVIVKLSGVEDRTAAEALVGAVIKIPPEKALPLEEDEYYIRDLLGMDVWTEDNERLGAVRDVLRTGANDVYAVRTDDGQEILLPAIKQCVLGISLAEKKMRVRLLEGLRD